ncbi:MAG: TlpA family protein disulfide reductase [Bacteroidales bacterium]|nr:TlpA family protein disulfide reductase [Bacteroidales bacterium]
MKFFKIKIEEYKKKSKLSKFFDFLLLVILLMVLIPSTRVKIQQLLLNIGITSSGKIENSNISVPNSFYNWQLVSSRGEVFDMQLCKNKVVFINFWATWCSPCVAELPYIDDLNQKFKDNANVVIVTVVDESFKKVNPFMKKRGFFFNVFQSKIGLPSFLNKGSIPNTFIIDKEGKLVLEKTGSYKWNSKQIVDYIEELSKR